MSAFSPDHPLRDAVQNVDTYVNSLLIELGENGQVMDLAEVVPRLTGHLHVLAIAVKEILDVLDDIT